MNDALDHLEDDFDRISHAESNQDFGFIVHFHRLSIPGSCISSRDWSPKSKRRVNLHDLNTLALGENIEIYYAMSDLTNNYENGVWVMDEQGTVKL
jgi:hypothetical protein